MAFFVGLIKTLYIVLFYVKKKIGGVLEFYNHLDF